jgi:hypothetical protein
MLSLFGSDASAAFPLNCNDSAPVLVGQPVTFAIMRVTIPVTGKEPSAR